MSTNTSSRGVPAAVMLAVTAALALLAVLVHYAFMAEYGDITGIGHQGLSWQWTASYAGIALILVAGAAVITFILASRRWMRVTAVAIPILMLLGVLAATPLALQQRLEVQYAPTPQCVNEGMGGPVSAEERNSQRAFDSIEHIGHFSGGGASGIGGCDRFFVLTEDVDVLEHYRAALPAAGWKVIQDDGKHLRALREGLAFEVIPCTKGGIVWAGSDDESPNAQCDQ